MFRIELLYWSGCPSHRDARKLIDQVLPDLAVGSVQVEERLLVTPEDAVQERFVGSPTFRIHGRDVFPAADIPSLTCRVYRRRDGRPSPLPDRVQLLDALRAALTGPLGPFGPSSNT